MPVKEKPILFSAPMVRAILEGRKTQTRRVIKPQPLDIYDDVICTKVVDDFAVFFSKEAGINDTADCPFGRPGDRLWVRETWSTVGLFDNVKPSELDPRGAGSVRYHADGKHSGKLRPSIFMPRWASRITLEITDIRVERLNSISDADAIAEGIESYNDDGVTYYGPFYEGSACPDMAYRQLWESINGPGSWELNPWVWVVEFKRVEASQ